METPFLDSFRVVGAISDCPGLGVKTPGTFSWFGRDNNEMLRSLRLWEADYLTCTIEHSIRELIGLAGGEAIWLTICATGESDVFDIPRWHRDGIFFSGTSHKFVVTLLGPGTLLMRPGPRASLLLEKCDYKKERSTLAISLAEEDIVQSHTSQVVEFFTGEDGAVHSEPPLTSPRVFVSVLPGSLDQITELATSWGRTVVAS